MRPIKIKKNILYLAAIAIPMLLMLSCAIYVQAQETADTAGIELAAGSDIYAFQNVKKEGTVTVIKKWDDTQNNESRPIPDITISTKKPEGITKKYTVTFHGNGLPFADGTADNIITYSSNGGIIDGTYKVPDGINVCWYTDTTYRNRVMVSDDGKLNIELTENMDLYAKEATFVLKSGPVFDTLIPDEATSIVFTDEEMPQGAVSIEVDDDGDAGVTAWMDGTVMKVSTQIAGIPALANTNCKNMFAQKSSLSDIQFQNLDTSAVTSMLGMFSGDSGLETLDLSTFNTSNVVYMNNMFSGCNSLTEVDLASFQTSNVENMNSMFYNFR